MQEDQDRMWQVLRREQTYDAAPWVRHWIETIQTPSGVIVDDFHVVELPDFAIVVATTVAGLIVSGKSYLHGARAVGRMLPAGLLEPGESALEACQRELLEETGYMADDWRALGTFVVDGNRGCGKMHAFSAANARRVAEPDFDPTEEMELCLLTSAEATQALAAGEFLTLPAAAALALALPNLS